MKKKIGCCCKNLKNDKIRKYFILSKQLLDIEGLNGEIKLLQDRCIGYVERINIWQFEEKKRKIEYINLKSNEKEFFYKCGLTVLEFDCLFDCLAPFLNLLINCTQIVLTKKTRLIPTTDNVMNSQSYLCLFSGFLH